MNSPTIDHIGIAVASLDDAAPLWTDLLQSPLTGREIVKEQRTKVAFVGAGQARVELLAPTDADSPVGRYLARNGPGLHHICLLVPDIRAALSDHVAAGYELIDREPRVGAHGRLIAFIHPKSTGGVLIELAQDSAAADSP